MAYSFACKDAGTTCPGASGPTTSAHRQGPPLERNQLRPDAEQFGIETFLTNETSDFL